MDPVLSMELAKYRETLFCSSSMFSETAKIPYTSLQDLVILRQSGIHSQIAGAGQGCLGRRDPGSVHDQSATVIMGSMIPAPETG